MKKSLILTFLVFLALTLFSCNDEEPYGDNDFIMNMVTFEKSVDGVSTFSYQAIDDSPLITLTDNNLNIGNKLVKGQRIILYYSVNAEKSNPTNEEISVRGTIGTIFDSLLIVPKSVIELQVSNPMKLNSIWRTGDFINIHCQLQFTGKTRTFDIYVDESTINDETVDLFVIDNILGNEGYYYRRAYSSFYIGKLWNLPTCKGIRVHLNDLTFPATPYYEFEKK